ncbi:unnamed protein product, partial [Tenebrio molitor]
CEYTTRTYSWICISKQGNHNKQQLLHSYMWVVLYNYVQFSSDNGRQMLLIVVQRFHLRTC